MDRRARLEDALGRVLAGTDLDRDIVALRRRDSFGRLDLLERAFLTVELDRLRGMDEARLRDAAARGAALADFERQRAALRVAPSPR